MSVEIKMRGIDRAKRFALSANPERVKELTLIGIIVLLMLAFGLIVENYFSGRLFNRLQTGLVIVAMLAVGQTVVVITRNIDLSVGSTVGMAAYVTGTFLGTSHWANPFVAIGVAVAVGAVLGAFNGVIVAYGGVPSIIATLGTMAVFRTLLSLYSGGANITADTLPDWVIEFNRATVLSIGGLDLRLVFAIGLVGVIVMQLALGRLTRGRQLYAVGSNPEAADQAGLPEKPLVFWAFVTSGAFAGLAGFFFLVRIGTISATAGTGLELQSVAAAVVGGVSVFGGSGTIFGAFLGATLISMLELSLIRVPQVSEFWRDALLGMLILGAVLLDFALQQRFARRWTASITKGATEVEGVVATNGASTPDERGRSDA